LLNVDGDKQTGDTPSPGFLRDTDEPVAKKLVLIAKHRKFSMLRGSHSSEPLRCESL